MARGTRREKSLVGIVGGFFWYRTRPHPITNWILGLTVGGGIMGGIFLQWDMGHGAFLYLYICFFCLILERFFFGKN